MLVKLLGGLSASLGKRVEVQANSVAELLDTLVAMGGPDLSRQMLRFREPGKGTPVELNRDLRVLVNGRSIVFLAGVETVLREEDTVVLHMTGARGHPGG